MKTFLERFFAILGAAAILPLFILVGQNVVASRGEFWPFPGLYMVEIILLVILGLLGVAARARGAAFRRGEPVWISAGALLGLSLMGLWSIGAFLLPTALAFTAAGLVGARSLRQDWSLALTLFILAAAVQITLMLGLVAANIS